MLNANETKYLVELTDFLNISFRHLLGIKGMTFCSFMMFVQIFMMIDLVIVAWKHNKQTHSRIHNISVLWFEAFLILIIKTRKILFYLKVKFALKIIRLPVNIKTFELLIHASYLFKTVKTVVCMRVKQIIKSNLFV